MALIEIRGLRKRFGDTVVLDGIDLDIEAGRKIAVIGPSGSGKSTLLRVLMALETPEAGEVRIGGDTLWPAPAGEAESLHGPHLQRMRRKVGMVFQQFNLFPHMNVLRNLTVAQRVVLGRDEAAAEARALELLDQVGLVDKREAWPAELSGGQKQRVAICRALALDPEVMLFDEITSALDPELVGEVLGVLRALAKQSKVTMLIVTHQMHFARDIADRVLFFDKGRVVEDGPPAKLFTEPEQPRTREFLRALLEQ